MEKKVYEVKSSITLLIIALFIDSTLILSFPNLVLFFVGCALLLKNLFIFLCTSLKINNKKIIGKQRFIRSTSLDLPLKEVKSVEVYQNFFGKIFDHGSIIIQTQSNKFIFRYIPNPHSFKYILENEIEKNKN